MLREPMGAEHTIGLPQEPTKAGGSTIRLKEPRGEGHSASVPQELPGVSPSTQEQVAGLK